MHSKPNILLAAAMAFASDSITGTTPKKRMGVGMWSQERLQKEYDLIQAKESVLSRRERDAVVNEYKRRAED